MRGQLYRVSMQVKKRSHSSGVLVLGKMFFFIVGMGLSMPACSLSAPKTLRIHAYWGRRGFEWAKRYVFTSIVGIRLG